MANCMICNVEFDPAAGTSKNFCPLHCAPVPGAQSAGQTGNSGTFAAILFLGMAAIIITCLILLFTWHIGWFLIVLFGGSLTLGALLPGSGLSRTTTNPAMICPHCQTKGSVSAVPIRRKVGISGGKATAAILTGGLSVVATGLSRKESGTQAHCFHCGARWIY